MPPPRTPSPTPHNPPRSRARSKRSGDRCRRTATPGKLVCHFHGGAPGSGAPLGNANARKHGLYAAVLRPAELPLLDAARSARGLDEEIALLRVRLQLLLDADPRDDRALLKAMDLLVRAVAVRHRIAPGADDLPDTVAAVFEHYRELIEPPGSVVPHVPPRRLDANGQPVEIPPYTPPWQRSDA